MNVYLTDDAHCRCLPRSVYKIYEPSQRTSDLRGSALMESKARVTLVVSCNSTGDLLVPLAMIGTAVNPRCFEIRPCSINYKSQVSSWMDAAVCTWWVRDVFIPFVKKHNSGRKVALLWDNLSSHVVDPEVAKLLEQVNVSIFHLPANTTSRLQPLDQGIIYSLKREYRTSLLEHYVDAMTGDILLLRAEGKKQVSGKAGLKYGMEPHLLEVSDLLLSKWSGFKRETIINCFLKSGIFPPQHVETLSSLSSKDATHSSAHERDVIKELSQRMSEVNLSTSNLGKEIDGWYEVDDDPQFLIDYSRTLAPVSSPGSTSTTAMPSSTAPPAETEPPPSQEERADAELQDRLSKLKCLMEEGLISSATRDAACLQVLKEFGVVSSP